MKITILATPLMMLAYFLVLYGAVGFIQDKRFFGSAPQENLAAIPDKKERFRGAHGIGWGIEAVAVLHKALIGAHTNDIVEVEMPSGIMKYKVLEIQRNV